MIRTLAAALATTTCLVAFASPAAAQTREFNIPAGSLRAALDTFARDTGRQVIYRGDQVRSAQSPGVRGAHTAEDALDAILAGTGFRAQKDSSGAFAVAKVGNAPAAADAAASLSNDQADGPEIVVTGTNIKGVAPVGSPVETFDRTAIQRSGAGSIDQFVQKLPQNFGGGVAQGTGNSTLNLDARQNNTAGATVNLRGLGSGATLVLFNGHRVAPSGGGSFVDITMLPVAAVDRLELLTDGGSAIYGSDAIAGVANFVLRKDFKGAETSLRYGLADGGVDELRLGQVAGTTWSGGGGFLSYEYYQRDPLYAGDRSFARDADPLVTLLPKQRRHSVLGSINQDIGDRFHLTADGLYSTRKSFSTGSVVPGAAGSSTDYFSRTNQFNAALDLTYKLSSRWAFDLSGVYSTTRIALRTVSDPVFAPSETASKQQSDEQQITGRLNGDLLELPGGTAKVALGVDFRRQGLTAEYSVLTAPEPVAITKRREIVALFGELVVPLVGPQNAFPGVHRLELSIAGRYDHYSDFGHAAVPKLGIAYEPVDGLKLRGSYSEAFRAPLLKDLVEIPLLALADAPDPSSPTGTTLTLFNAGDGNSGLKPERAKTWTFGIDVTPKSIPIELHATLFNVDFTDRILVPAFSLFDILPNANLYASLIKRNPSAADVSALLATTGNFFNLHGDFAPGDVQAIVDGRISNVALQKQRGIDTSIRGWIDTGSIGRFEFEAAATYLFRFDRAQTATSPLASVLNIVEGTNRFRARAQASWTKREISTGLILNYIGRYTNQLTPAPASVSDWATLDAYFSYAVPSERRGALSGVSFSLTVNNLLNSSPPRVANEFGNLGYDPANADPIGRFVAFEVRKRF